MMIIPMKQNNLRRQDEDWRERGYCLVSDGKHVWADPYMDEDTEQALLAYTNEMEDYPNE